MIIFFDFQEDVEETSDILSLASEVYSGLSLGY